MWLVSFQPEEQEQAKPGPSQGDKGNGGQPALESGLSQAPDQASDSRQEEKSSRLVKPTGFVPWRLQFP